MRVDPKARNAPAASRTRDELHRVQRDVVRLLPPLTPMERLETSMVWSVAGLIERGGLTRERPFRAPHHSASMAALTGGGVHSIPECDF